MQKWARKHVSYIHRSGFYFPFPQEDFIEAIRKKKKRKDNQKARRFPCLIQPREQLHSLSYKSKIKTPVCWCLVRAQALLPRGGLGCCFLQRGHRLYPHKQGWRGSWTLKPIYNLSSRPCRWSRPQGRGWGVTPHGFLFTSSASNS